jgi:hypothetical protein
MTSANNPNIVNSNTVNSSNLSLYSYLNAGGYNNSTSLGDMGIIMSGAAGINGAAALNIAPWTSSPTYPFGSGLKLRTTGPGDFTASLIGVLALSCVNNTTSNTTQTNFTAQPNGNMIYQTLTNNSSHEFSSGNSVGNLVNSLQLNATSITGYVPATFNSLTLNNGFIGTTGTFSNDITVNSLTVGRGGGNVSSNTAVGNGALGNNTIGQYNTAIGQSALPSNTTGSQNTAMGYNCMVYGTLGSQNTAMGTGALRDGTTGSSNSAFGISALINNTIGNNNVAIGINAGLSSGNTGAVANNNCTFLGSNTSTLTNVTGYTGYNNSTAIGAGATITGNNQIVLGTASENVKILGGLIGTTANFSNDINVNSLTVGRGGGNDISNTAVGYNSLLNYNFTGNTGYNTAVGYNSLLYLLTGGDNNCAFGYNALRGDTGGSLTGSNNNAFGRGALVDISIGSDNCAFGTATLNNTSTGLGNCAFGTKALNKNTIGSGNCAFGGQSLFNNTSNYNVAMGLYSMQQNTIGTNNCAFGYQALQSGITGFNNTAIGYQSMQQNTSGTQNTAIGVQSLFNNTTGTLNTASGQSALFNNTTGVQNTATGVNALYNGTTGVQNTATGYAALFDNTTGNNNVAIGYLAGNAYPGNTGAFLNNQCTFLGVATATNIYGSTGYYNSTAIGFGATITGNNQIVLGTASENVHILGTCQALSFNATSDYRIKTNIEKLEKEIIVDNLKPVQYTNILSGKKDMGFIAHELQDILPFLVTGEKDGPNNQSINYLGLIPLLVKEIQELKERVKILENKL